ncbi:sodium-dependent transporter [uncultured Campylobacter sp.]|uniref:sodium-dependent transporter n=1 Tax=uncultured Campylobacter sp. TaxID=218934 RepID=UPI00262975F8|nr:sodium-dependent transporter [uncultured Campylobacter sp.]
MHRLMWSSSMAYILILVGATVGFGASWRFPFLVGENGGGVYVLAFIISMFLLGFPIMLVENVIGKKARTNSVDAFKQNSSGEKFWQFIGYLGLLGAFGFLAYCVVLSGWVLSYLIHTVSAVLGYGGLELKHPISKEISHAFFETHIKNEPLFITFCTAIFVFLNYIILKRNVIQGIEKAAKYLSLIMLLCLLIMIFRNLSLNGAVDAIKFYLNFNINEINFEILLYSLGQVFFALSLGYGVIITLSSYMNSKENLKLSAFIVVLVNTVIAFLMGFVIFPPLFTANIEVDSGISLIFQSLPVAFSHMYFGEFFAIIFFISLLTISLSTTITVYQVLITVLEEKFYIKHSKAVNLSIIAVFVFGNLPCIFYYGYKEFNPFDLNILYLFDFASANILFVISSFFCVIYVGWVMKKDALIELENKKKDFSIFALLWFYYIKFIAPLIIILIFVGGFLPKIQALFL